jgi:hypothetical protein
MSVGLTQNFLTNCRGVTFADSSGATWSFDSATNSISVALSVAAGSVADNAITNAKLADMVQATIKGRAAAAGTGDPVDLTASEVKTVLALTSADLSDFTEAAQDACGSLIQASTTISANYNDSGNALTLSVIDSTITYAKIQNVSATNRILGRITAGAGTVEELTAANVGTIISGITQTWSAKHTFSLGGDFTSSGATGLSVDGQKWQSFCLKFTNTAGVIQHAIVGNPLNDPAPSYADKVSGASGTLANTPTSVDSTHGLTNGVGLVSGANSAVVLGTADQASGKYDLSTTVEYYDGNAQRVRVFGGFISRNVNGTTITRLELRVIDDMTAAGAAINTTLLPAGKSLYIRISGYLL